MKMKLYIIAEIFLFIILSSNCGKEVGLEGIPPGPLQAYLVNVKSIIPVPISLETDTGLFCLTGSTEIYVENGNEKALSNGIYLAERLAPATGFHLNVSCLPTRAGKNSIVLSTEGADQSLGEEGYTLKVTKSCITISALNQTGIFWGIQTLRQLFDPSIESSLKQDTSWNILELAIRDKPRYSWRGLMFDVARHFFTVDDIKRVIDEMSYYKLNRLHLHLADDQGWRIEIASWPNLSVIGGITQVGGGPGGFYTQAQLSDIINYANSRHIMLIPEIEMPGHSNAALASYPELNANGICPQLFTGINPGYRALAVQREISYVFVEDLVRELGAINSCPYIHLGGDECPILSDTDYVEFIERIQKIVQLNGKKLIGWEEIARAKISPSTIVQHWDSDLAREAVSKGAKVIMSPASKSYLDMKYNSSTPLGLTWAGLIEVRDAYDWDPDKIVAGVSDEDILGIESCLWTETISNLADAEFMMFPRLAGLAEVAWSPQSRREWKDYKTRLANHSRRWISMGVNYYHSGQIE